MRNARARKARFRNRALRTTQRYVKGPLGAPRARSAPPPVGAPKERRWRCARVWFPPRVSAAHGSRRVPRRSFPCSPPRSRPKNQSQPLKKKPLHPTPRSALESSPCPHLPLSPNSPLGKKHRSMQFASPNHAILSPNVSLWLNFTGCPQQPQPTKVPSLIACKTDCYAKAHG